jgi:hypothetical protein
MQANTGIIAKPADVAANLERQKMDTNPRFPDGTDAEEIKQYHWQTRAPVARAQDENYQCVDNCDGCRAHAVHGTMLHATGATGRVCPVLFLCDSCMVPDVPANAQGAS